MNTVPFSRSIVRVSIRSGPSTCSVGFGDNNPWGLVNHAENNDRHKVSHKWNRKLGHKRGTKHKKQEYLKENTPKVIQNHF